MTNLPVSFSPKTMTSREVADLAHKAHKNVLRDIDTLLETLGSELSSGFKSSTYVSGDPPREYRQFILDRDATICLVTGYDVTARMKIIKRWQELEGLVAGPSANTTIPQSKEFRALYGIARLIGLEPNQAAISANQAVLKMTGTNLLEALGQTHLPAPDQEQLLVVSEVAERLGWEVRQVNPRLTEAGLQTSSRDHKERLVYELTAQGRAFGLYLDTGKKHGDGTPVRQIKWRAPTVAFLRDHFPENA